MPELPPTICYINNNISDRLDDTDIFSLCIESKAVVTVILDNVIT